MQWQEGEKSLRTQTSTGAVWEMDVGTQVCNAESPAGGRRQSGQARLPRPAEQVDPVSVASGLQSPGTREEVTALRGFKSRGSRTDEPGARYLEPNILGLNFLYF